MISELFSMVRLVNKWFDTSKNLGLGQLGFDKRLLLIDK